MPRVNVGGNLSFGRRYNYACLECQKSSRSSIPPVCPKCRNGMVNMGMRWEPPAITNKKAWKKLRDNHDLQIEIEEARRLQQAQLSNRLLITAERREANKSKQAEADAKKQMLRKRSSAQRALARIPIIPHGEEV